MWVSPPVPVCYLYIDHPALNNNPLALLFITQHWGPGGLSGAYNPHESGVLYDAQVGKWAIFNVDGALVPVDAAFNIRFASPGESLFVHHTTYDNTAANATHLAHPLIDGNPQALLMVTQSWNGCKAGQVDPHEIGVRYDSDAGKWAIFNQDLSPMPVGVDFHVEVLGQGAAALVHRATLANTAGHITYIDDQPKGVGPKAILFVTQSWNPGGAGGTGNPHEIGVWYDSDAGKWAIFNQDFAPMPLGSAFNIYIALP